MVTNLRLMFARNLVIRCPDVQTLLDHEEFLLASVGECKNSRQDSVAVERWL